MGDNNQGKILFGKDAPFYFLTEDQEGELPIQCSGEFGYRITNPANARSMEGNQEVLFLLQKAIEKALGRDKYQSLPMKVYDLSKALGASLREKFGAELTSFGISSMKPGPRDPELIRRLKQGGTAAAAAPAKCAYCGGLLTGGARFCGNCGAPV